MSFFKKLFNLKSSKEQVIKEEPVNLSLDDSFVHHFIKKGGKFLYCISEPEVKENLRKILSENDWGELTCISKEIEKYVEKKYFCTLREHKEEKPFFTTCEHLIAVSGDILFSSNQLSTHKISSLSNNFIVFAKTSQLVKDTNEGLTGIKINCKKNNIPTNISAVKNYTLEKEEDDNFLNYGNNNSKNLYLLLLEDL